MKGNLYKFTVEYAEDAKGNNMELDPLVFQTKSHDEIFGILEKMKSNMEMEEDSKALVIGLKLFGGVMLKNKNKEPFKTLLPHFKDFMKELKKSK